MAIKQVVDKALQTPMSRKEFLKQVGLLVLVIVGVPSLLQALNEGHKGLGMRSEFPRSGKSNSVYPGKKS